MIVLTTAPGALSRLMRPDPVRRGQADQRPSNEKAAPSERTTRLSRD